MLVLDTMWKPEVDAMCSLQHLVQVNLGKCVAEVLGTTGHGYTEPRPGATASQQSKSGRTIVVGDIYLEGLRSDSFQHALIEALPGALMALDSFRNTLASICCATLCA